VRSSTGSDTLELQSTGTCSVPITGVTSTLGTVETYAGVPTTEVSMTPGVVTVIPLPAAAGRCRPHHEAGG
jgi:hypothetical protein